MSDELKAERTAFEAWASSQNWITDRDRFGEYRYSTARDGWEAWQAARCAAPADLDAEGLPPLQEPFTTVIDHNNAAGESTVDAWIELYEPLYTADQVRQAQRNAIAAYRRAQEDACGS